MRLRILLGSLTCLALMAGSALPAAAQTTTDPARVPNAPTAICPLPIGSPVPAMTLQTQDGRPFDLAAALKAKPTILIYFRGGW